MSSARISPNAPAQTRSAAARRSLRAHRLRLGALAAVLAGIGCAAPHESKPVDAVVPEGLAPLSVQMHIHGHSHHNGDSRPGSMQWHSHFADASGLDVLWWSDHSEMFDLSSALELDFGSPSSALALSEPSRRERRQAGHRGLEGLSLGLVSAPDRDVEWIEAEAGAAPRRRRLVARSSAGSQEFTESVYSVLQAGSSPKGFLLPRPISSGAVLSIDLEAVAIGADARIEVEVALSWHHRGAPRRQAIRYRLVPAADRLQAPVEPRVERNSVALIEAPVPAERAILSFDLERDAALLADGADNTVTGIRIRLASRRGARAALDVFGLELSSRFPEPDHQLAQLRRFAGTYAAEYGHVQNVGVEFLTEDADYTHINAFLPDGELTGALASGDEETWSDPSEFVRRVKALGGVTSFNHLFGTDTGRSKNGRYEERRSRERALDLLDIEAYGTDILEVGYLGRGGVGLEYHLRTWDLLTANGLYLYGNGVSDAHGSAWGPAMKPNPFTTWVWSDAATPDRLIAALARGRIVFGDPFQSLERLYFRVGEAQMGDRVRVLAEPQPLRLELDSGFDPERHRLFLVQGRIRRSKAKVEYSTENPESGYRLEIDPGLPPNLDVSRPCFVRLEIYDRDGRPLLFSNPIVFDQSSGSPR